MLSDTLLPSGMALDSLSLFLNGPRSYLRFNIFAVESRISYICFGVAYTSKPANLQSSSPSKGFLVSKSMA